MTGTLLIVLGALLVVAAFHFRLTQWLLNQLPEPRDANRRLRRRLRQLYDGSGIPTEQYVLWKLRFDPVFNEIDRVVPRHGKILDAGCGCGLMANFLSLRSGKREIIGVDLDAKKIAPAQRSSSALQNAGTVTFIQSDLLTWEFSSADAVLLIDVLHYWSADKQGCLIAKAAGCLLPGGRVIFREGMRKRSWGHGLVHAAERWAVWLGHNPRGDGLCFQPREFYEREFARHGLVVLERIDSAGRGSNGLVVFSRVDGAETQSIDSGRVIPSIVHNSSAV